MSSFEKLIREHDEIGEAARRLEDLVASYPPDSITASDLLDELAILVRDHLREEDRGVYTALIEIGASSRDAELGDLEAQFPELSRDWLEYLDEWSGTQPASHWPAFSAATAAMMPRLRQRVRTENDLIYPAALRAGAITLRDRR